MVENLKQMRLCPAGSTLVEEVPDGQEGVFLLVCPRGLSVDGEEEHVSRI